MSVCLFSAPNVDNSSAFELQNRAINSWKTLTKVNTLLLGNKSAVSHFGIPTFRVNTNVNRTPLVNSMFNVAVHNSDSEVMMYTNCDIVYNSDLNEVANLVSNKFMDFLVVGRRTDIPGMLPDNLTSQSSISDYVTRWGKLHIYSGIDYFMFNPAIIDRMQIPSFAVGRAAWDNWMIGRAKQLGIPVVNATSMIQAIHQGHKYYHVPGGYYETRNGEEASENRKLASDVRMLIIKDADYLIRDI